MKPIEELLKNLGRAEVLEFGLVTNRLPSVNIGGKFEPVDDEAPTTDILLRMLVAMGGGRYVEQLSERPVQWTARLDGVGVIAVAAIMRKDIVQARFTVARRDSLVAGSKAPPPPASQRSSQGAVKAGAPAVPAAAPSAVPPPPPPSPSPAQSAPQSRPELRRAPLGAGGSQPNQATAAPVASVAPPAPAAPAAPGGSRPTAGSASSGAQPVASPMAAPSSAVLKAAAQAPSQGQTKAAAPPGAALHAVPSHVVPSVPQGAAPAEEWDDDDEPTVQTLSPPVAPPPQQLAARQAQTAQRAQAQQAQAQQAQAPVGPAAEEAKPKPPRKPGELSGPPPSPPAADERKIVEERAAAERKAADDRAAHERKIIEERAAAERKAADDRKAAAERAQATERAAEHKAAERAKVERRISTPTSVDAVDVEITTSGSHESAAARASAAGLVLDGVDNTVELAAPHLGRAAAAVASNEVPSGIPSTTPSATVAAEKDRPRADGALESFLAMAVAARATDLHVVAGRPLLLRVATDLLPRTQPVQAEHVERIAREIVPGRLRETLEVDGACDFAIDHPLHGRFRVNVSRQRTGFKLSMRVIPREIPTLASLALPDAVGAAAKYAQGLVLVTGPAGHGKTTTLAAIVDILNRDTARHVLTVEDPIEVVHPRKRAVISQREVGTHARSFASALEASFREDADVIVIGELRDAETLRVALEMSEAGHLVIGTMSTPSAAKTVDRVIEMFPPSSQAQVRSSLANVLRLVVGQRLVPSVDRTRLHAAVELLPSSIALYTLIRDGRTVQIPSLQQRGRALGVVRLDESLAELVRTQKVTLEAAKQLADSPPELETHATRSIPPAAARKV